MSIRQCVQAIANDRKDLASARADLERVLKKELTAIRQTEKRQQKKKKPQNQSTHEGLPLWAVPANVEMAFEKSSPDELGYADANLVLRKMKILSPMTEEDEETVMEYVSGKASTDGRIQLPEMLACVVAAARNLSSSSDADCEYGPISATTGDKVFTIRSGLKPRASHGYNRTQRTSGSLVRVGEAKTNYSGYPYDTIREIRKTVDFSLTG